MEITLEGSAREEPACSSSKPTIILQTCSSQPLKKQIEKVFFFSSFFLTDVISLQGKKKGFTQVLPAHAEGFVSFLKN